MLTLDIDGPIARITLDDPDRRNALSEAMFDSLMAALDDLTNRDDILVLRLDGAGRAFCAGFDLAAAVEHPAIMGVFIRRLSDLNRSLRHASFVVIAAVQGAALAGGCAMVSACDLVVASRGTRFGYPVHRIGVTPAVTIATLQQVVGSGPARAMLMGGEIIDGGEAHRLGLVSHLVDDDTQTGPAADEIAERIAGHGPRALRETKWWLNELDGSMDDERFVGPALASGLLVEGDEAVSMLADFWADRQRANS